jgi:hypothetical protein
LPERSVKRSVLTPCKTGKGAGLFRQEKRNIFCGSGNKKEELPDGKDLSFHLGIEARIRIQI